MQAIQICWDILLCTMNGPLHGTKILHPNLIPSMRQEEAANIFIEDWDKISTTK